MAYVKKYMTRIEYLNSLPKDKDGHPIIKNMDEFYDLESCNGWEMEFVETWVIGEGYITAYDYPEFFQIQE